MPEMHFDTLLENPYTLVATMATMLRAVKKDSLADLMRQCDARLECTNVDNWNGGTYSYTLFLSLNPREYAKMGKRRLSAETTLLAFAKDCLQEHENHDVTAVALVPRLITDLDWRLVDSTLQHAEATKQLAKIWDGARFRLFLSHTSKHKVEFAALKQELHTLGVSAFLAHEDISPADDWRDSIILALKSCDSLAALLTEGFRESDWCDQEVGFAICREVFVLPVRYELFPYGFFSKPQALTAPIGSPTLAAEMIVKALLSQVTGDKMREALVVAAETCSSWAKARRLTPVILSESGFSSNQLARLKQAATTNREITGEIYSKCSDKIIAHVTKLSPNVRKPEFAAVADDEYDPFWDED